MTQKRRRESNLICKTVLASAVGVVFAGVSVWPTLAAENKQKRIIRLAQEGTVVPLEKPEPPVSLEPVEPAQEPKRLIAEMKSPETNWSARCTRTPAGVTSSCHVIQRIKRNKTGALLMSVLIDLPVKSLQPELRLSLPLGLYLPAGTTLKVDRAPTKEIEIETCDSKGCYAAVSVDEPLLTALKLGNTLTVTFQNVAKEPIAVPVTLVGFTAAFAKIR